MAKQDDEEEASFGKVNGVPLGDEEEVEKRNNGYSWMQRRNLPSTLLC